MSVITIQLGQCGNQVGADLFSSIVEDTLCKPNATHVNSKKNEEYCYVSKERFFTQDDSMPDLLYARAIMVDMEPKVINQSIQEARRSHVWRYRENQQICQKTGSGNNWAHGYCIHGRHVEQQVMETVRREVERCDHLGAFICFMSLAGGTGSGLGTFITQSLRNEYPNSFIVNQVVWPYQSGEVIVQNYNALLTLSHLYQIADAVLLMENDHLHKICSQRLGINKISFRDLNRVASHQLAGVLQPATAERLCGYSVPNHLGELIEQLSPHPEYKLLTVRSIPQMSEQSRQFSTFTWPGLLKHLRQMLIADSPLEEGMDWQVHAGEVTPCGTLRYNRSLSNLLILRGTDIAAADTSGFKDTKLYADWMPSSCMFAEWKQARAYNQYEKSATLVSNSMSCIQPLAGVVSRAWDMFSARAYIHQYSQHGILEEDFLDCFATLEQVIASYKLL